ncbi:hypothetical protein K3495_g14880 [Podosphaera aphanis]|nr:hypothetical protein K3495_g14880 [Podosphaera aphanis]
MQPLVETTARKDRAFRLPGEVLSVRDGKSGRTHLNASIVCADQGSDLVLISPQLVRVLNLKKNALSNTNGHAITMGTADGASHSITEWVSFVFASGGVSREVHAFVRPDKGATSDLFSSLGVTAGKLVIPVAYAGKRRRLNNVEHNLSDACARVTT